MNCRIPDFSLRAVCRELLAAGRPVSHRMLREVLRQRFGATGKTARLLKVWREEVERFESARRAAAPPSAPEGPSLPRDVIELQDRLVKAESLAQEMTARAEVAELREQSHSARWLLEIDSLRQQLRAQPDYAREVRTLQATVTRLTVELAAWRGGRTRERVGEGGAS